MPSTHSELNSSTPLWMYETMMAELLGWATGTNKGKGGTLHIADIRRGMLETGTATAQELDALDQQADWAMAEATRFAEDSPFAEDDEWVTDVYMSWGQQRVTATTERFELAQPAPFRLACPPQAC